MSADLSHVTAGGQVPAPNATTPPVMPGFRLPRAELNWAWNGTELTARMEALAAELEDMALITPAATADLIRQVLAGEYDPREA
jgi:hypothetical protein